MTKYERPADGWKPMRKEVWMGRVKRMKEARDEFMKLTIEELVKLLKLLPGNRKTGGSYYTISLIPILDCVKDAAKACGMWCYDIQSVCITKEVIRLRAINSALHAKAPNLYWQRIRQLCELQYVEHLRINVGGDITKDDMFEIVAMAVLLPNTIIHLFTKNYEAVNNYFKTEKKVKSFPKNLKVIFSRWPGMKCENPYKIPECHVDFGDGKCEAPEGSELCGGNCTKCAFEHSGCHGLKKGEAVVIKYHTNAAFAIQKGNKEAAK